MDHQLRRLLVQLTEHLLVTRQCSMSIIMQVQYAKARRIPWTINIIRTLLIQLHTNCKRHERTIQNIEKMLSDDHTLDVRIRESQLQKYDPDPIQKSQWINFIEVISDASDQSSRIFALTAPVQFSNDVLMRFIDTILEKPVDTFSSESESNFILEQARLLAHHYSLLITFLQALNKTPTLH